MTRSDILVLLEKQIGAERMAGIAAALGDIPPRSFAAPPMVATMLFASRSGSSYAGRFAPEF